MDLSTLGCRHRRNLSFSTPYQRSDRGKKISPRESIQKFTHINEVLRDREGERKEMEDELTARNRRGIHRSIHLRCSLPADTPLSRRGRGRRRRPATMATASFTTLGRFSLATAIHASSKRILFPSLVSPPPPPMPPGSGAFVLTSDFPPGCRFQSPLSSLESGFQDPSQLSRNVQCFWTPG